MKTFTDGSGNQWVATVVEEETPRHHGRWYLVFRSAADGAKPLPMPEVRWQTAASADRTIAAMSEFELRKRLSTVLGRRDGPSLTG